MPNWRSINRYDIMADRMRRINSLFRWKKPNTLISSLCVCSWLIKVSTWKSYYVTFMDTRSHSIAPHSRSRFVLIAIVVSILFLPIRKWKYMEHDVAPALRMFGFCGGFCGFYKGQSVCRRICSAAHLIRPPKATHGVSFDRMMGVISLLLPIIC